MSKRAVACIFVAACSNSIAPPSASLSEALIKPAHTAMPGIFVVSETQGGFVEQPTPCAEARDQVATRDVSGALWYLCRTPDDPASANYQRTMESTLANPAITGVFIRLKWGELQTGPNTYDDTTLLREVDAAVAHGKAYSLGIKAGAEPGGTPSWLFDAPPAGAGLTPVTLDWNEDETTSCTGHRHNYGDPTDEAYLQLYLDMLSHVASVLRQDCARWDALTYVKISGANARSAENRLPNGCKAGRNCICNDQRWSEAGYTPSGLYHFYEEQMRHIAHEFPGKTQSYPLLQAGFPRVNERGCYFDAFDNKVCPGRRGPMVGPFEQTEHIIDYARATYGDAVAIAHLGLGPLPDFSDPQLYAQPTGCPIPLAPSGQPAHGAHGVGSGCPNYWASSVGSAGGLTHYQTNNTSIVDSPELLASTLENLWQNSTAAMLEVYESVAWQSQDIILDPSLPVEEQRTLADWNLRLHARAAQP